MSTRKTIEASNPPELLKTEFGSSDTRLYVSKDHYQNFLDCIKSRQKPIADVEIGHRTATVCHLGNMAVRLGRKIQWDPAKEQIVGDVSDIMYDRPYRRRGSWRDRTGPKAETRSAIPASGCADHLRPRLAVLLCRSRKTIHGSRNIRRSR